jgi:hypothetical protein
MNNIHISIPSTVEMRIERYKCSDCKKLKYFVVSYYEWYGSNMTCLNCGRDYNEDGWMPFYPPYKTARKDNICNTKKKYRLFMNKINKTKNEITEVLKEL